jgi:Putative beta-barrel porin-2, OmpL-like. bbp2
MPAAPAGGPDLANAGIVRRGPRVVWPALTALLSMTGLARAGGGVLDAYDGIRGGPVDVHGLVDGYFQGNLAGPASHTNQLRAFDTQANRPALGMLRLTLAHEPEVFGFRIDAGVGDLPNGYLRADPAATAYPGLSQGLSYLEQAFVTARVAAGGDHTVAIDAGKFGTPVGLEDNEALGNWNYSRSFLYQLAEPSFHTGVRVSTALTRDVGVALYWVNGWDANVLAGNGMRALAGAVSWEPTPGVQVVADYMGGPERAPTRLSDPTLTFRHELDAYATWQATRRLMLAYTVDYGLDAARGGVSWWGLGGYLRVGVLDWLSCALRAEHFADGDGFTSGTAQRLAEVTGTVEVRGTVGPSTWIGRLELRRDQSDARAFEASTPSRSTHQDTLGVALLVAF